ncbi:Flavodoxin reductases (ferredoxin-NADPH reductases) family 1 protein [Liberibacter crescens BT-1]|uniref:ferredoxin--NADP(+) reductase n=1 Tax=Liberibacter crescens (strain BT-1) TaxID=1215343 RepID=L0ETP6_LIBCB|nr:ferredoxin--NADP reductase [Liberibacter crescens]AGA64210.1 Flavodoxin reductases (ferredoxin-NADPH reductases) family 1 protein [Liberibacter crescens BT-1]AMC12460.1 ferredoxin-NADP reductase [Liberibacter crescens]
MIDKSSSVLSSAVYIENVITVKHYTDQLFLFCITRPNGFRFRSGEFVMIGLIVNDRPIYRAYSIASPCWDEKLEFFSIKVQDGPLTSHLHKIQPGDSILMHKKSTGTLVLDALIPGKRLYMFSTGTGIAPFASLIRDPETYEKFDEVVLTHSCRNIDDLKYGFDLMDQIQKDDILQEFVGKRLQHYTSVTREDYVHRGRITNLIASGEFYKAVGVHSLNPDCDRAMICGSVSMINDMKILMKAAGFSEGSNSRPGEFVTERAFS